MLCSQIVRPVDAESLVAGQAREALFRDDDNGLIPHLSAGTPLKVVRIEMREALIWLNETPDDVESSWPDVEQRNGKVGQGIQMTGVLETARLSIATRSIDPTKPNRPTKSFLCPFMS